MRIESRVTSVSWIPSEAVTGGASKAAFSTVAHHDDPPPDVIAGRDTAEQGSTLQSWRVADRYRFSNQLAAFIEVDEGAIADVGYCGEARMGTTTVNLGLGSAIFQPAPMRTLQAEPEFGDGWVRFEQTAGGRTGL